MSQVRKLGLGLLEFIVGDDWRLAVGVLGALGLTSLIAHGGVASWWVLPSAVAISLTVSVRRAARRATADER